MNEPAPAASVINICMCKKVDEHTNDFSSYYTIIILLCIKMQCQMLETPHSCDVLHFWATDILEPTLLTNTECDQLCLN